MWKIAVEHLYAFSETHDIEELHRFRIEIKKIFALAALQQFNTLNSDFFTCLKPVRTIFLKAGEIRNIQLSLLITKDYSSKNSQLFELQHAKLTRLISEFSLRTDMYIKNLRKAQKFVLRKICDIETCRILSWYEDEVIKLSQLLVNKKHYQKNIHKARISIKKLLYVYSILHKTIQKKLRLNKGYLHRFEESIGKWHDTHITMKILSNLSFVDNETKKMLSSQALKLFKSYSTLSKDFLEKIVAN